MDSEDDFSDSEISNYFRSSLIDTRRALTHQEFKTFATLDTGGEKVAFILRYPEAHETTFEIENREIKDHEKCKILKEEGNMFFGRGDYNSAAKMYSNAILVAPKQELGVLFANRSAALYHLEKYELALSDTEEAMNMNYPKELHYKVEERRARCFLALKRQSAAAEAFKSTLTSLDHAKLPTEKKQKLEADMRIMLAVMEKGRQMKANENGKKAAESAQTQNLQLSNGSRSQIPELKDRNPLYPALSKAVEICDAGGDIGRHAIATRTIEPGEIVGIENAHSSVLLKEFRLTNCNLCQRHITAPVPASCYVCSSVAYCSRQCRDKDEKAHRIECQILGPLWCSDASVTCIMALKAVIQQPFERLLKLKERLNKPMQISNTMPYKTKDYVAFHNLVTHEDERTVDDIFHRAFMASWLLRLLKTTDYIPTEFKTPSSPDAKLSAEELFLADLLFHNLQLLQFNSHEVSELRRNKNETSLARAKSTFIGGGVYPTMALLNHSCNPGVIRYFVGTTMISRAIRTINKDEEICDNYGPIFTLMSENERKRKLRVQYWFECGCEACRHHWPLLEDLDPRILRFKCETASCKNILPVKTDSNEFMVKCTECGNSTNILKGLKSLQDTDALFKLASNDLEEGNHDDALKSYLKILKLLDETLALPIKDYHVCQQGVRLCTLTLGNTAVI